MTTVALANILKALPASKAVDLLDRMLDTDPDLLGLLEWTGDSRRDRDQRHRALRRRGAIVRKPWAHRFRRRRGVVWVRKGRGPILGVHSRFGIPRTAQMLTLVEGDEDHDVRDTKGLEVIIDRPLCQAAVLVTHLMAHHDRPANRRAWEQGKAACREWAREQQAAGREAWVLVDANKHLMELPPLVSCWDGRREIPTFRGRRTIDIIYGPRRARSVRTVPFGVRDHDGVVAEYDNEES